MANAHSPPPTPRGSLRIASALAGVSGLVSLAVVASWLTGPWHFFSVGPGLLPTAPSAELMLTAVNLAALGLVRYPGVPFARRMVVAVAAVALLAGGATLVRFWLPGLPPWDGVLVAGITSAGAFPVGVMAPHAGGTIVLLSAALLCLLAPGRRVRRWETLGSAFALLAISSTLVALTAALFGGALLTDWAFTSMAMPTAILMGATASALLAYANPEGWMLAFFATPGSGTAAGFNRALLLTFVAFVIGFSATGAAFFKRVVNGLRDEQHRNLVSVANMKANSVAAWRHERAADAASLATSPVFRLSRMRHGKSADAVEDSVAHHLRTFLRQYGYDSVEWHVGGISRVFGKAEHHGESCPEITRILREGLTPGEAVITAVHRETPDVPLGVDVVAAVSGPLESGKQPVTNGYVVLSKAQWSTVLDDQRSWPGATASGQVLLVQAGPDEVLVLDGGGALAANATVFGGHVVAGLFDEPAGSTAVGRLAEGLGARGEPMLAVAAMVADTTWYVVATIDRREVYAAIGDRIWMGSISLVLTVLGVALGLTVIRRQRDAGVLERELHERRLREDAEQSYRTLFREMQEGCALHEMVYDDAGEAVDYRFLAVNPAFERMTGLRSTAVVGRTVLEALPGIERHWIETYGRVVETGEDISFEAYTAPLDKHFLVTAFRPSPGRFACVFHDITERRRAELGLRESEEKFCLAFQMSPHAITIERATDGRFVEINAAFTAIAGYSREEALASSSIGLCLWADASDRDRVIEELRAGMPVDARESQLRKKNGELMMALLSARNMVFRGESCVLSSIQDITDQRRTRDLLIQTEKMMSVGGLAAGMAHELNNPLGVIRQAVENAERRLLSDLPANRETASRSGITLDALRTYLEQREIPLFLNDIRQATARSGEIVGGMLRFSRRSDSIKESTWAGALVDKAIHLASNDATLRESCDLRLVDITIDIPPDLPAVVVAPTEIEQVLLNLLTNAGHAMAETASVRPPRLTIRAFVEGDACVIEVRDNGPGLDPDVARRVFEPFFTTKKPGSGTGLGLSVAYAIVTHNHDGQIWVDSVRGEGACFSVKLPVTPRTGVKGVARGADHA